MLGRIVEQNALTETAAGARDAFSRRIIDRLSTEDLPTAMTGQRYDDFRRFVQESVVSDGTTRIELWAPDGTVVLIALSAHLRQDVSHSYGS